jgi:NADH-quinone oxidoreductase subunit G
VRYPPSGESEFLAELAEDLAGEGRGELASFLRGGGEDIVIVWGERLAPDALPALLLLTERLGLADAKDAGLLEIPAGANGRGLREAGALPGSGPGYSELDEGGRGALEMGRAAAAGELSALYLFQTDPLRDLPDRGSWEQALHRAGLVVAHASVLTEGIGEHADVVFPAESHAEKEGTVVHPDGRIQRLRTSIAHPGQVRAGWWVLAELAKRVGLDTGILTSSMVFPQLVDAVPFYGGLTLEEIGGRGLRWPEREQAGALRLGNDRPQPTRAATQKSASSNGNGLRLGTYRPIWAAPEVEVSPALKFLIAHQQVELSPQDAQRLEIASGDAVEVACNGNLVRGTAAIRASVPAGTAFLAEGIASESANALTGSEVEVRKR